MSIANIQSRLKRIEDIVFYEDKDKWRLNHIYIQHRGTMDNINQDKKYWLEYEGKELVYDNIEDFYKEYNIYPKKDINPQIIEVVDNSHLERFMYECNRQDKSDAIKGV